MSQHEREHHVADLPTVRGLCEALITSKCKREVALMSIPTGPTPYYQDEQTTLYLGDALDLASDLPDQLVDCIVTSPPYFGLRDYGVDGQMGAESSPAEYVARMVDLFRELRRALADDGTLWLNLGDSYSTGTGNRNAGLNERWGNASGTRKQENDNQGRPPTAGVPPKNLLGMPWRVAFALQDDGWVLRQEIIWSKRNCMPEAVNDRPSRSHETVFLFAKSQRYWYDADAIREQSAPEQEAHNQRYAKVYAAQADRAATTGQPGNNNSAGIHARPGKPGRNARSVWTVSAQPFPEAHFATMPPEIAERCVQAGCKTDGTVLDPFSGSGTTGMAASRHGRKYIGFDLNRDYLDLSLRTRLSEPCLDFGGVQ